MRKLFLSLILSLVVFVASAAGISNYKEFVAFAKAVNKEADLSMWQNEKGVVCLTADIDMKKGKKFPTINVWKGKFDGCGHKLYNWPAKSSLFGTLEPTAVVENIVIDASCKLSVTTSVNDDFEYVSFIAKINRGKIANCVNHGTIEHIGEEANKEIMIGAIAACNLNIIYKCKNTGAVSCRTSLSNSAGGKGIRLGGLVGTCYNKKVENGTTILRCENTGNISFMGDFPNNNVGGIVGESSRSTVKYCVNRGNVVAVGMPFSGTQKPQSRAGGITAWANTDIVCCDNFGVVAVSGTHEATVGGICARPNNTLAMVDCINHNKVSANTSAPASVGGIMGQTIQAIHVAQCFNYGLVISENVDAPAWCGGAAGLLSMRKGLKTGAYFRDCANYANVINKSKNSRSSTGGFIGSGSGYTKGANVPVMVYDCANFGKVEDTAAINYGDMFGWTNAVVASGSRYDDMAKIVKPAKDGSNIFGRVVDSKGAPIQGVVVSDGEQSVKTDVNGEYTMKSNMKETRFVMISVPAKYEIPMRGSRPQFFRRVPRHIGAARADFVLTERRNQSDKFVLAMIGDPQTRGLKTDKAIERFRDVIIPDLNSFINDTQEDVYAVALGDVVYNYMTSYDDYISTADKSEAPLFNVIGNHDFDQRTLFETKLGTPYFEAYLAPQNYSFNIGKMHFVVVNDILYNRATDKKKYRTGVEGYTLKWLQNDLKHVSKETTIVICSHAPLMKDANNNFGAKNVNFKKYSELLAGYNKVYAWAGHTHQNYSYDYANATKTPALKNIESIVVARCSGQILLNRELLTCGTPNGYMVAEVDGDEMKWYYKAIGHDRNYQIRPYSPTSTNTEFVKANIWNYSPDTWSKPEWWENGVKVADMEHAKGEYDPAYLKIYAEHQQQKLGKWERSYSKPAKSPYLFRVKPTAGVRSGEIRVTDQFGVTYTQKVEW